MEWLLDVLMPPACTGCGRAGSIVCGRCREAMEAFAGHAPTFVAPDASVVVGEALAAAVAAFPYEGALRRVLAALKYRGAARVARPLADAAYPSLRLLLAISGPTVLVPVPIHRARRRRRGYNQASLIAGRLATLAELPMVELLMRSQSTERQHGLNRAERMRNMRGAIAPRNGASVPACAIVVDDILTTSATLEVCADALRSIGVGEVYGFAIAREI